MCARWERGRLVRMCGRDARVPCEAKAVALIKAPFGCWLLACKARCLDHTAETPRNAEAAEFLYFLRVLCGSAV